MVRKTCEFKTKIPIYIIDKNAKMKTLLTPWDK